MENLRKILNASLVLGTLAFSQFTNAQKISQQSVNVIVNGTSSLHDWDMNASAGTFTGSVNGNTISNATFTMPVKNLTGKKGKMMNNKAYAALKSDKAPNISFSAASIPVGKSNVNGKLSIAGVTKNISLPVTVTKKGNAYVIAGAENLKLSDYGMERPGFMGVKTGDEISVKVNITAQ